MMTLKILQQTAAVTISAALLFAPLSAANAQEFDTMGAPTTGRSMGAQGGGASYFRAPLPPEAGAPTGRARGGGIRGGSGNSLLTCQALTALVPAKRQLNSSGREVTSVWALTTEAHPTLWFYVPHTMTADEPGEFVLFDSQRRMIYRQQNIIASSTPGIMAIELPETLPPLETGRMYRWNFQTRCGGEVVFVEGWIQRTELEPAIAQQISTATSPLQKAALYAENGIWHDALTLLGTQRRDRPADPTVLRDWQRLLDALELGEEAEGIVQSQIAPIE